MICELNIYFRLIEMYRECHVYILKFFSYKRIFQQQKNTYVISQGFHVSDLKPLTQVTSRKTLMRTYPRSDNFISSFNTESYWCNIIHLILYV